MINKNHHYYRPFLITLSLFGFLFSLIYFVKYQAYIAGSIMLSGPIIALLYMYFSKAFFFTKTTAHVLLFIMLYTIGGSSFVTGANNSTAVWWLITIPVASGVFLSIKDSLKWMSACLLVIIFQVAMLKFTTFIPNEFAGKNTEFNKLLSLLALVIAMTALTTIHLSISKKLRDEYMELRARLEKTKVKNAFNQGILESTQNTLHTIGNTLTMLKSNIDYQDNEKAVSNILDICQKFEAQQVESQIDEKNYKFIQYIKNNLTKISSQVEEQKQKSNQKIDKIIGLINSMNKNNTEDLRERVRLSTIINEILIEMTTEIKDANILIQKNIEDNILLFLEPQRLELAIKSSIKCSIESLRQRQENDENFSTPLIEITTKNEEDYYKLTMTDNGISNRDEIFKIDNKKSNMHNTANYISSVGGKISLKTKNQNTLLEMSFPK